jgi:hypothetical protein
VTLQLNDMLAGVRTRGGKCQNDPIINGFALIMEGGVQRATGRKRSTRDLSPDNKSVGPRYSHDANRTHARRGCQGDDGVVSGS